MSIREQDVLLTKDTTTCSMRQCSDLYMMGRMLVIFEY
jgi:hypothetical protein